MFKLKRSNNRYIVTVLHGIDLGPGNFRQSFGTLTEAFNFMVAEDKIYNV